MKSILSKSNKRGQISIVLGVASLIVIGVIIAIIIIGAGVFFNMIIHNILLIVGLLILIFGMIFGVSKAEKPIPAIIIVVVLSGIFIGVQFSGLIPQTALPSGNYYQVPTINYYECAPASQKVSSPPISISSTGSGFVTCPSNSDECDVVIKITGTGTIDNILYAYRLMYQICDISTGSCQSQIATKITPYKDAEFTIKNNMLKSQKIFIDFQRRLAILPEGVGYGDIVGASYYFNYKPFILWKNGPFIGRVEYSSVTQGCTFTTADKNALIDAITNSKAILSQTSTNDNTLQPYKTRNFAGTFIPVSTENVDTVTYNGQPGYCMNRQIFSVATLQTNSGIYNIVDTNFNNQLASSVTCCPSEKEPTRNCNDNFQWVDISQTPGQPSGSCSLFNPCAGIDWQPSTTAKTLVRYNCINSQCVAETKTVDCTSNNDCVSGTTCDTLTYTCVLVPGGENGTNEKDDKISCELKAQTQQFLGYEWISQGTTSCGFFCSIGFSQPKTTTTSYCSATFLIWWVVSGLVLVIIIALTIYGIVRARRPRHQNNKHSRNSGQK